MSSYEKIIIEKRGNVASVIINNPPINIITLKVMDELTDALKRLIDDPEVRIVILRPGTKNICSAGADVKEHLPEMANDLIFKIGNLTKLIISYPKPTICVINGKCLGGGMEIFISCDFVIATKSAELAVPEIKLATMPPIAIALLPKIVGLRKTYEIVLLGNSINAEEARNLGLVNFVVDDSELDDFLSKFTNDLLEKSQIALNVAKRAILESHNLDINSAIDHASSLYLNVLAKTYDYTEGLKAFLEKRKPIFKHS